MCLTVKIKCFSGARLLLFVIVLLFYDFTEGAQGRSKREFLGDDLQGYLMQFGYMEKREDVASAFITEHSIRSAIKELQDFAHIPVTGILDETTKKLLKKPRCGMPDKKTVQTSGRRRKRFALHGSKWPKTDLTWTVRSWGNLNQNDVRRIFTKAFQVWSNHSKLEFRYMHDYSRADIIIHFYSKDHGDRFPFDDKGQVLAHAFFPTGSGSSVEVHFDSDEIWNTNGNPDPGSTNLFNVAAHEFGHSLGLQHSSVEDALMYPWYQEISDGEGYQLPQDDKHAIQQLYGRRNGGQNWDYIPKYHPKPRTTTTTTQAPRTRYTPRPNHPYNPYSGHNHPVYYPRTEKPYYPRKQPMHPTKKHYNHPTKDPRNTHHNYPEVNPEKHPTRHHPKQPYPGNGPRPGAPERPEVTPTHHPSKKPPDTCDTSYDAVATIRKEMFVFKDAYFWRISDQGLLPGYPAEITRLWRDLPRNFTHLDAVYERQDNKIVFFIGKQYYVFTGQKLNHGYPKPLTHLGLPQDLPKVDGAMVWGHNGHTYFYSGNIYWRFDESEKKVELDYPRDMAMWKGVGRDIDAVFQWRDGKTYFFKGKYYWKFNDQHMRVEHKEPKLSAPFWMGCSNNFESNDIGENLPYKGVVSSGFKNDIFSVFFAFKYHSYGIKLLFLTGRF
ncbi:unnamed protein product [Brassicogethes aeneus]|uniref:Peptidase metallopeptidase domain-containing protein n=1 Tax=Brassicogethes aeneus TaxID=1431903 RepID=A0A9P0BHQ9_BRAAE|nr:unnamed protein product [Brassicogethes aeneus]